MERTQPPGGDQGSLEEFEPGFGVSGRTAKVLELYEFEPAPIEAGANAGTRTEGVAFARQMRALLAPDNPGSAIVVETQIGKSSNAKRLDGNAHQRVAYKMVRFKRNPLMQDHLLVVAFNAAFERYRSPCLAELQQQAAWLNAIDSRGQILLLSTQDHYLAYLAHVFGSEAVD